MMGTLGSETWLLDFSKSDRVNSHARCSLFGVMPSQGPERRVGAEPRPEHHPSFAKNFMLAIKARNQARNPPRVRHRRGCVCSSHYHDQGELHGKHDQQRGVAGGKGECE